MDLGSGTPPTPTSPNVVVISGGTAANSLVSAFASLAGPSQLTYVLPIRSSPHFPTFTDGSDNGGSTSEISRVLGGPGIGDIRSRLIRLMNDGTPEQAAIKKLMSYRLSRHDGNAARTEWLEIVEGMHLYTQILFGVDGEIMDGHKFGETGIVTEFSALRSE
jgi:2-phospho-L-lactate transferase/gluconeogenesis factor (CofD/UPF0052 family)